MAKNSFIRPQHVEAICHLIHGWDKPSIDWSSVCSAAESVLGYRPSRSGLSSKSPIQDAFKGRKKGLKIKPAESLPKPNSLAQAARTIAARDAEIAALKLTREQLLERFARWEYNAYMHRVSIEELDAPLTEPDLVRVKGARREGNR